ncbi:MAG: Holliday junction branch migration protein RuvA [Bacteroidales bacterium]|nr:Holliday junction branch migration protein RuvA [Bacteroidales bacterium]MBP5396578.1 Holliday junction branch migration protein RuvA [Bacteroidales bacterium]MBP5614263.1 Holliday junction branch migration protein RuvA [Bacteroidales bacterium]
MITHIEGTLTEKNPTYAIIDCGGVGFMIHISLPTYSSLPEEKSRCKLFTHFVVKEDAQALYGFASTYERELFRLLIGVSGIGAGTARMMLSAFPPEELAAHIASGDTQAVQSIKGVGAKTAQRVVMELKDKVQRHVTDLPNNISPACNKSAEEALSALVQLGFSKPVASKAVQHVLKAGGEEQTVEEILRSALKML